MCISKFSALGLAAFDSPTHSGEYTSYSALKNASDLPISKEVLQLRQAY